MASSALAGTWAGLHYQKNWPGEHKGVPLLILPGLLGDSQNLRRLGRDLSGALAGAVGAPRPVLFVDPLGGGRSEVPDDAAEYAWEAQADRLIAVLAHLGLVKVDVLGLSMGGMWAQHALLGHPQRFRGAVLAATSCRTDPRMRCILQALLSQIVAGLAPLDIARSLLVLLFSPAFLDRPGAVPLCEALLMAASTDRPSSQLGLRRQIEAILSHDLGDRLCAVHHVTGLIIGEMDWLTTNAVQDRLRSALSGSPGPVPVRVIPGAGHCLWVEEPARFAQAVLEALPDP